MTTFPVIPVGYKFSALAFADCLHVKLSSASIEVATGLHAYTVAPFELPQHWKEWMGTLKAGHFTDANLVLLISRASTAPGVLDQEIVDLELDLQAVIFGVMVSGVPDYSRAIWFSGANVAGEVVVRRSQGLDVFYRTPGQRRPILDDVVLAEAATIGTKIRDLFRSADYRRVRLGLNKLVDGLKRSHPRGRLHEFVRSIDGLMALEVGKSTRQFAYRGQTFARFAGGTDSWRTLYKLRSAEEHLNDWRPIWIRKDN